MKRAALLTAAALTVGCVTPRPRLPDATRPPTPTASADFAPVFEARAATHSVTAAPQEKALLRRVMLSPNLVFEPSRSSLREPEVSGPRGGEGAPALADAVGRPVETWLSSLLMSELVARGAALVAPAMSRQPADTCEDRCNQGTWVERVLFRYVRAAAAAKGPEELAHLPTAVLAVRELGLTWTELDVLAVRSPSGDLLFRPRRSPAETSACGPMKLEVPVVRFSAEVLSLRDGRILARIDEATSPSFKGDMRRSFEAATVSPVRETIADGQDRYTYVARWNVTDVSCANAQAEYQQVRAAALRDLDVVPLARDVIATGLSRLGPPP